MGIRERITSAVTALVAPSPALRPEYIPPKPQRQIAHDAGLAARAWDGLQNVIAGLGTSRDKRTSSVYSFSQAMTLPELDAMYRTSWLAGRIVDTVADDMTRAWIATTWEGRDEDEGGIKAIELAEKRFAVRSKVNQALKWARLYGGAVILIGIKGQDWSTPLNPASVTKGSLQFLHVLDRWRISPAGALDTDVNSPNLGLPLYYAISDTTTAVSTVHWSRVVRFDGRQLPYFSFTRNGMWHDSELERVIDSVKDYDTTKAGIATMVWEANVDIIRAQGLADKLTEKDGEAEVIRRFAQALQMKSFNRVLLLNKGDEGGEGDEEYTQKTTQFSGVVQVLHEFMVDVCGAADIPMTRLFGQSPGGLNATGDSDAENYNNHVNGKQETHMRPQLELLEEVLIRSETGTLPKGFTLTFNPLSQMSDTDKAAVEKSRADRDHIYFTDGVVHAGLIARELKDRGTYRTMEDADVHMAEELDQATKDLEQEQKETDLEASQKKLKEPAAPPPGQLPAAKEPGAEGEKPKTPPAEKE